MERTTQIFLTVGPQHKGKVEEEEEKGEEEGRVKIESVSAWVKKEVGASEEGGLVAVRAEEMAVKEELEIDAPEYKGLLPYIEFDVKEEWSDFKKAEEEEKDLEDKEEEEVSGDDEQVDARLLYPRRAPEETSEEEDEEAEGKLEEAVVKSIEIMEASCFGQMEEQCWEDGKDKRLNCERCGRQFASRSWLARCFFLFYI